jgi:hypothetical protein
VAEPCSSEVALCPRDGKLLKSEVVNNEVTEAATCDDGIAEPVIGNVSVLSAGSETEGVSGAVVYCMIELPRDDANSNSVV